MAALCQPLCNSVHVQVQKVQVCVLVTVEPAGLIIPSQLWGISTGFHIIPKQDARVWSSRQAAGELRGLCMGITQAQISLHAHAAALQVSHVSAKPPLLRIHDPARVMRGQQMAGSKCSTAR